MYGMMTKISLAEGIEMTSFKRLMSLSLAIVLLIGMIPTVAFGAGIEEPAATEPTEYAATEDVETMPQDSTSETTAEILPTQAETEAPEETAEETESGEAVTEPSEIPTMPEETTEETETPLVPETEPDAETLPEETEAIDLPEESLDAALGEADALWKGTCGKNLRWYVDGKYSGRYDLHINGTGPMDNYDMDNEIYAPWNDLSIERIFIESGVTSIGDLAFWGCLSKVCRFRIPLQVSVRWLSSSLISRKYQSPLR